MGLTAKAAVCDGKAFGKRTPCHSRLGMFSKEAWKLAWRVNGVEIESGVRVRNTLTG